MVGHRGLWHQSLGSRRLGAVCSGQQVVNIFSLVPGFSHLQNNSGNVYQTLLSRYHREEQRQRLRGERCPAQLYSHKPQDPEYSLQGLMLKLKLWHFGHLRPLEKTLMPAKTEGRRRGQQWIRWLGGIIYSVDTSLHELRDSEGGRNLVCHGPWSRKESDTTGWLTRKQRHRRELHVRECSGPNVKHRSCQPSPSPCPPLTLILNHSPPDSLFRPAPFISQIFHLSCFQSCVSVIFSEGYYSLPKNSPHTSSECFSRSPFHRERLTGVHPISYILTGVVRVIFKSN